MALTLKLLKEKLKELEDSGKINGNTVVCGYADEFDLIYPIKEKNEIILDIDKIIEELESDIDRINKNIPVYDKQIERKRRYINDLKKLGHVVIKLS